MLLILKRHSPASDPLTHPPTAFTPVLVRRRVAGMKQVLLMITVVALVGCVSIDSIVEKAVRKGLKKPPGELTKADCEKVRGWISPSIN